MRMRREGGVLLGASRRAMGILGAFLLLALGGILATVLLQRSASAAGTPFGPTSGSNHAVQSTQVLDASLSVTLNPPSNSPARSAQQAWAAYANSAGSSQTAVPGSDAYAYGLLQFPSDNQGPQASWTYRHNNVPTYVFQTTLTCPNTATAATKTCDDYTLLNADTGAFLDELFVPTS